MELFLELLKITIPSLIVFLTAYYIIKKFFENQEKQRKLEQLNESAKITTPIRLHAYERVILYLERISPDSIIMRLNQNVKTSKELQTELLNNIRSEFEHNLAQQLYISSKGWEMVKNAKGNLIKLINTVSEGVDGKSSPLTLSQAVLEKVIEMKKSPVYDAIEYLKQEVKEMLG